MTLAQQHGFRFVPADAQDVVVRAYVLKHLFDNGYPIDIAPAAEKWIAIVRKDGDIERVYGVFGWKRHPASIEITDFYLFPDRWGVLAGYAALERIKENSDRTGIKVITATPTGNSPMMKAYKRIFGEREPVLLVYQYDPKATDGVGTLVDDLRPQATEVV